MSGPKVVDIQAIRRQQRRECDTQLRELRSDLRRYIKECEAGGKAATEANDHADALLERLQQMRDGERFSAMTKEVTVQRHFYRAEADRLEQNRIESRAVTMRREYALQETANQLQVELANLTDSEARDSALAALGSVSGPDALAKAISQALALTSEVRRESHSNSRVSKIRELAAQFEDPDAIPTPTRTPKANADADETRLTRCWALLAEVESTGHNIDPWWRKAREALNAPSLERPMLVDSLVIEMTSHLRDNRLRAEATRAVESAMIELDEVRQSPERTAWTAKLTAALQVETEAAVAMQLVAAAREWLQAETKREDARAQRDAVLRALAEQGYEVRDGMATAWVEEGRVIIQKPNETIYGLELSAPPTGTAFQVRVVATGNEGRTTQRDKEVEQTWCTAFDKVQSSLRKEGFETRLSHASDAGVVPIKTVQSGQLTRTEHRVNQSNQRTLR
jgi:hypothetical protein